MPLQRCRERGKAGWRWGKSGKCYVGPNAKKKAIKRGLAIEGPEKFAKTVVELLNWSVDALARELKDSDVSLLDQLTILRCYNDILAAKMTRKDINDLPDSDFAIVLEGGEKDSEGKTVPRSLRKLPIHDEAHVRNALARLPLANLTREQKKKAFRKIAVRAKKFGIEISKETRMKYE